MSSQRLGFYPPSWLSSKHLQMISAAYLPSGSAPPSEELIVDIGCGDKLSCHLSTPPSWSKRDRTTLLLHGLGGSHESRYMVRMARKLYQRGQRVVRMNLRNCGSGAGLSHLPYCAANSDDLQSVIIRIKEESPLSELQLVGFSLGGSIISKFAGELGSAAQQYVNLLIAICAPIDLYSCIQAITARNNLIYHKYYLRNVLHQASKWVKKPISSLYEFDDRIIAPTWGFKDARDYYQQCSCGNFISKICCPFLMLFAEDDPFVSLEDLKRVAVPNSGQIFITENGGHMGFIDSPLSNNGLYWLDHQLLHWLNRSEKRDSQIN